MNNRGATPIVVMVMGIIVTILAVLLLLSLPAETKDAAVTIDTPRPTAPVETPAYKVFVPYVSKWSLTPTVTPRPTGIENSIMLKKETPSPNRDTKILPPIKEQPGVPIIRSRPPRYPKPTRR